MTPIDITKLGDLALKPGDFVWLDSTFTITAETSVIDALLRFVVRERTHPECPPDKRFVARIPEVPGEWATREAATDAVLAYAMDQLRKETHD